VAVVYFSTFKIVQWIVFAIGWTMIFLSCLYIPFPPLLPLAFLGFLFSVAVLFWAQLQRQAQLDRHNGSIPMPGIWGLLGADLVDSHYSEVTLEDGTKVRYEQCPKCGDKVEWDQLYCPNCDTVL
jgi:ribosomal protein S27AE